MKKWLLSVALISMASIAQADLVVTMHRTQKQGQGPSIGTITISQTEYGLLFKPNLHNLTYGAHGFHLHQNPDCSDNGMAAGGHFDPLQTNKHQGPFSAKGHLGDIPRIFANKEGHATTPVLAPRLKLNDLRGHSLVIHAGSDNYSDEPPLGGGGGRFACGVIPAKSTH